MYTKNSGTPHFMGFRYIKRRAIDGTRTRDFHLGKVALYQLSHYRIRPFLKDKIYFTTCDSICQLFFERFKEV